MIPPSGLYIDYNGTKVSFACYMESVTHQKNKIMRLWGIYKSPADYLLLLLFIPSHFYYIY